MRAAVFSATREGHTRRIANRIAIDLRALGAEVDLFDVRAGSPVEWSAYSAAVVAASVHVGHHEREMITLVRRQRPELVFTDWPELDRFVATLANG